MVAGAAIGADRTTPASPCPSPPRSSALHTDCYSSSNRKKYEDTLLLDGFKWERLSYLDNTIYRIKKVHPVPDWLQGLDVGTHKLEREQLHGYSREWRRLRDLNNHRTGLSFWGFLQLKSRLTYPLALTRRWVSSPLL